jgi:hypothetical protein
VEREGSRFARRKRACSDHRSGRSVVVHCASFDPDDSRTCSRSEAQAAQHRRRGDRRQRRGQSQRTGVDPLLSRDQPRPAPCHKQQRRPRAYGAARTIRRLVHHGSLDPTGRKSKGILSNVGERDERFSDGSGENGHDSPVPPEMIRHRPSVSAIATRRLRAVGCSAYRTHAAAASASSNRAVSSLSTWPSFLRR